MMAISIENKNPLVLAFVGDAVQTLYEREKLCSEDAKVNTLHKQASVTVCATAQAKQFDRASALFTETEHNIANRARNAGHNTVPKSCTLEDYKKATALEAVIGYNYLSGNKKRVEEILEC